MEIVKEFSSPLGIVRLYDDGVIRTESHPDIEYTLEKCRATTKILLEEFQEEKYPWLIDTRNMASVPDECQEYMRKGDHVKSRSCTAIVTAGSLVERSIVNFFMSMIEFSGYAVPTKLFENLKDAERWIEEQKKKILTGGEPLEVYMDAATDVIHAVEQYRKGSKTPRSGLRHLN